MTQFFGNTVQGDFLYINLSNSQSGNSSTVSWALYWAFRSPTLDSQLDAGHLDINGERVYSTSRAHNWSQRTVAWDLLLSSGSRTIGHNSSGNLSIGIGASVKLWNHPTSSFSATYTLPRITRPPSQPGTPSATALGSLPEGRVAISWGAPADNGGLGIDGYNVYDNGGLAQQTGNTTSTTLTYGVGTPLNFRVEARNAAGTSPVSAFSSQVIANGNPAAITVAPLASTGTVNKNSVNLSWNAAAPRAGSIVGYYVFRSGSLVSAVGNTTSLVLNDSTANPDLPPNTANLSFSVAARNQFSDANSTHAGLSPAVLVTSSGPPGPPQMNALLSNRLSNTAGIAPPNAIRANWLAPASLGNPSGITGYDVLWSGGGQSFSASVSGSTLTYTTPQNLVVGTNYSFSVVAKNSLSGNDNQSAPAVLGSISPSSNPTWQTQQIDNSPRVGLPYSTTNTISRTPSPETPISYSISTPLTAPPGLVLATIIPPLPAPQGAGNEIGVFSGILTTQGKYSFQVTATLSTGSTITASFVMNVLPSSRKRVASSQIPVTIFRRFNGSEWLNVGQSDVVSGSPRGANQPIGMFRRVGNAWFSTTIPPA